MYQIRLVGLPENLGHLLFSEAEGIVYWVWELKG